MKNLNAIASSIDFIESKLTETVHITELAQQSFFSKTHYQRLFKAIVGEPVMKYVKNRRLQLACHDMLAHDTGVLDIALKYGYDSHEGFTRAFKAYFGMTPSEYRKGRKLNEREAIKMLSKVLLIRIEENAEKISASLGNFIEGADKLSAHAHKAAKTAGAVGITTAIVATELDNLSDRVRNLREELKSFTTIDASAFEMFEKLFNFIRCIDDMVFQMNLLRFFSGIETGRVAPSSELDKFSEIDEGYAKLCTEFVCEKEQMITLMNEAVELLHSDIKQEAENCMKLAIAALNKAIEEGEHTFTSADTAAKALGERGKAFSYVAEEVSKSLCILKSVSEDFSNTHNFPTALSQLSNSAYGMNINAFNATIETARVNNPADCLAATEKIMKYAGILPSTFHKCEALCNEYERLTELTKRNSKQSEKLINEKCLDDIIFQSGILSTQFALEATRINRDEFLSLANSAITSHEQLTRTRDISKFSQAMMVFLQELNRKAFAPEIGGSFAYFAKEYGHFKAKLLNFNN